MQEKTKISPMLRENEAYVNRTAFGLRRYPIRPMRLGEGRKVDCLMVYIEVATSNMMLDDSAIGKVDESLLGGDSGADLRNL